MLVFVYCVCVTYLCMWLYCMRGSNTLHLNLQAQWHRSTPNHVTVMHCCRYRMFHPFTPGHLSTSFHLALPCPHPAPPRGPCVDRWETPFLLLTYSLISQCSHPFRCIVGRCHSGCFFCRGQLKWILWSPRVVSSRRGPTLCICLPAPLLPCLLILPPHLTWILHLPHLPQPPPSHPAPLLRSRSLLPLLCLLFCPPPRLSLLRCLPPHFFSLPLPLLDSPCALLACGDPDHLLLPLSATPLMRRCPTSPAQPSRGGETRQGEGRRAEGRPAAATHFPHTPPRTLLTPPPLFLPHYHPPAQEARSVCSGQDWKTVTLGRVSALTTRASSTSRPRCLLVTQKTSAAIPLRSASHRISSLVMTNLSNVRPTGQRKVVRPFLSEWSQSGVATERRRWVLLVYPSIRHQRGNTHKLPHRQSWLTVAWRWDAGRRPMTWPHTRSQTCKTPQWTHKCAHRCTPRCTPRWHLFTYRFKQTPQHTRWLPRGPPLPHTLQYTLHRMRQHPHTHISPSAQTSLSNLMHLFSQTPCLSHKHTPFHPPRGAPLSQGTTCPAPNSPSTNPSRDIWVACRLAYQTLRQQLALPLLTTDWEAVRDSVQRIGGPPNEHWVLPSGIRKWMNWSKISEVGVEGPHSSSAEISTGEEIQGRWESDFFVFENKYCKDINNSFRWYSPI